MPLSHGNIAESRNVVIPTILNDGAGNAFGLPGGAFGFQMRFAQVLHTVHPGHSTVDPAHKPNFSHTEPVADIPENRNWNDPDGIVSFHPRGHLAYAENQDLLEEGWNFRPTIAVTRSTFRHPSISQALDSQTPAHRRLHADDTILHKDGSYTVTDVNIDPVWNLEAVAKRLDMDVQDIRRQLFESTGMYQEFLTRKDLPYFLPPIDGQNIHIFGDVSKLASSRTEVGARSHDFCRDGDNFAQRCTCAYSKEHAIEELIKLAQAGGVGILVMNPEEGRNFGSVIKHLVYNKREKHPQGDSADRYFESTRMVAGGEDARMHWNKADPFKWLMENPRIDHWFSESPHKRGMMAAAGVQIVHQYALPEERIPPLATVEMAAKHGSGYEGKARK